MNFIETFTNYWNSADETTKLNLFNHVVALKKENNRNNLIKSLSRELAEKGFIISRLEIPEFNTLHKILLHYNVKVSFFDKIFKSDLRVTNIIENQPQNKWIEIFNYKMERKEFQHINLNPNDIEITYYGDWDSVATGIYTCKLFLYYDPKNSNFSTKSDSLCYKGEFVSLV